MKKNWIIALSILAAGCQKEMSVDLEPGLTDNQAGLLQKIEVASLPQNQVYLEQAFTYDDSGRIATITQRYEYPTGGGTQTRTSLSTFTRDSLGRTTTILYTPDSFATKVVLAYQGASRQLLYVNLVRQQGTRDIVIDSLVYTYNSDGQPTRTDQFVRQANGQLKKVVYHEYSWDARGNLLFKQTYDDNDDDGLFTFSIGYNWSYDDKPNPRQFRDPAFFYWTYLWPTGGSANNVLRQVNKYPPSGGPDDSLDYVFQYRPDDKPSTETQNLGASITRYIYY